MPVCCLCRKFVGKVSHASIQANVRVKIRLRPQHKRYKGSCPQGLMYKRTTSIDCTVRSNVSLQIGYQSRNTEYLSKMYRHPWFQIKYILNCSVYSTIYKYKYFLSLPHWTFHYLHEFPLFNFTLQDHSLWLFGRCDVNSKTTKLSWVDACIYYAV